jgi:replicative DNA helicase
MSIKKIGLRISTVNLERQLLHGLLQNKFNLQRTLGKHKADYFTSESRRFIYEIVNRYFNDKRVTLSKENFDYELQKRFDPISQKSISEEYSDEFNIIKGTALNDNIELVIEKLDEVQLAQNVDQLIKEAYSKLENGNYQDAANLLRQKSIDLKDTQKEGRIINLHCDSDDWFEEVQRRHDHPEIFTGIPTGFEKFDKMTGGLFPAELTIVFGLSGKGKSTFMKALTTNIRKQGKVVLHCGNEENEFQMRTKYMSADSGEKYSVFKRGNYTDEEYNRLKIFSDNARGVGAIYIYEFPQQTDTTWIERAYRQLEMQGVKVDAIVIDYLDLMKPIQQAYSENDEQGKVTSDLKQLAINCNCPVITATQAGTSSEKQEKKARPFLTSADVFGTKRKVHSANTLIGIVNQTATVGVGEEGVDRNKHRMVLCVPKNRDGAVFTFRQIMDVTCGKFYEDTDDDDPVMKNLEKQASEMIDETLPPDKIRSEIDEKEIVKAQEQSLLERLQRVQQNIEEDEEKQSQEDPFFDDAPQAIPTEEEVDVIEEDPFLNDVSEQAQEETKNVEVKEESKFSFLRKKKHQ